MKNEVVLVIHPFAKDVAPKDMVLKPLEEASEIYSAWQRDAVIEGDMWRPFGMEIADCIQACVNLAARYNIDLNESLRLVEEKNRKRGYYREQLAES